MLKAVVEQQNVGGWELETQDLGSFVSIGADADG